MNKPFSQLKTSDFHNYSGSAAAYLVVPLLIWAVPLLIWVAPLLICGTVRIKLTQFNLAEAETELGNKVLIVLVATL